MGGDACLRCLKTGTLAEEERGETSVLQYRLRRKILNLSWRGKYKNQCLEHSSDKASLWGTLRDDVRGGFESLQPGKEIEFVLPAPHMRSARLVPAAGGGLLALLQKVAAAVELHVACAQTTFNGKRPSLISFMEAPYRKCSAFGLNLNKYETWQAERLLYLA